MTKEEVKALAATMEGSVGQKLLDVLATKIDIRAAINARYGREVIPESAKFEDYADLIRSIPQARQYDEGEVSVTLNMEGEDFDVPTDPDVRAELLDGAYVEVRKVDGGQSVTAPLTSLEDFNAILTVEDVTAPTQVAVVLHLGESEATYSSYVRRVTVNPGAVALVSLNTYNMDAVTEEIGRVQDVSTSTGESRIIRRITNADGTVRTHFGQYSATDRSWQNQTGLKVSVWQMSAGGTPTEVPVVVPNGTPEQDAVDIVDRLAALIDGNGKRARRVTVRQTDDYATVFDDVFMLFPKCYVKTETVDVDFPTEGSTVQNKKRCTIKWMCRRKADDGYEAMSSFQDRRRRSDNTFEITELDYALVPVYGGRSATAYRNNNGAKQGVTILRSCPASSGGSAGSFSRGTGLGYARNRKYFATQVIDGGQVIMSFPKSVNTVTEDREWSGATTADVTLVQWISYIMFGIDPPAYLRGIQTATGTSQTVDGTYDYLYDTVLDADTDKRILFGGPNVQSNTDGIIACGIESATWSSEGWHLSDVTSFAQRFADDTAQRYFAFVPDRRDYAPESTEPDQLFSNGAVKIVHTEVAAGAALPAAGINHTSFIDRPGFRDLMLFTNAATTPPNIRTLSKDSNSGWWPTAPAAGSPGFVARLVSLGFYRNDGSNLGPWCWYANYGVTDSGAGSYRPRLSYQLSGPRA